MVLVPEVVQPTGTQTRGEENPFNRNTRPATRLRTPARPRSSLSHTLALLKQWLSLPNILGTLMISKQAMTGLAVRE